MLSLLGWAGIAGMNGGWLLGLLAWISGDISLAFELANWDGFLGSLVFMASLIALAGMVGRITSESLARRYEGRRGRLFRVFNLPIFDERLSYYYYHH